MCRSVRVSNRNQCKKVMLYRTMDGPYILYCTRGSTRRPTTKYTYIYYIMASVHRALFDVGFLDGPSPLTYPAGVYPASLFVGTLGSAQIVHTLAQEVLDATKGQQ